MASPVPTIVVLALGAGALGGADALRLLLAFAGQSPLVDIAVCIFSMSMVTTQILGVVLLVRFVRKARAQGGGAPGARAPVADHFAQMTLVVSVGVAVLVCSCLLLVSGGLGSVCLLVDFAAKSPIVTVLATGAAAAFLPRTTPLLRIFRGSASAGGAAAPAAARATGRFAGTIRTVPLVAICVLVIRLVAPGGLDERSLFPGLPWQSPSINWPVGVAIATVAVTTSLVLFSRRACNAAGAGGGAATDAGRFAKLTEMPYAPPGLESDGGKHACSA